MIRAFIVAPPIPREVLDIGDLTRPVADGPMRPATRNGRTVEEWPVKLAPGHSVAVPIGSVGEVEIGANDRGQLTITVPLLAALLLRNMLGNRVVDESGLMKRTLTVRCAPGDAIELPIGSLGAIAIKIH